MANRLGVGVVGLGSRWARYEPVLAALSREVRICAVYDPLSIRTAEVAQQWKCAASGGVVDLVERPDVDVVFVLGDRLGLWPVERALHARKPVYCAVSPLLDEEHLSGLRQQAAAPGRVHLCLWPALDLFTGLLAETVFSSIGDPQALQVVWQGGSRGGDPLDAPLVLALIDSCRRFIGKEVAAVRAITPRERADFVSILLEFPGGGTAQLILSQPGIGSPGCRIDIQSEHGSATLTLPRRLRWRNGEGTFTHLVPQGTAEMHSVEGFLATLEEGGPSSYDLPSALASLDTLVAARCSREKGSRVKP